MTLNFYPVIISNVTFCSRYCQKKHWNTEHKNYCFIEYEEESPDDIKLHYATRLAEETGTDVSTTLALLSDSSERHKDESQTHFSRGTITRIAEAKANERFSKEDIETSHNEGKEKCSTNHTKLRSVKSKENDKGKL